MIIIPAPNDEVEWPKFNDKVVDFLTEIDSALTFNVNFISSKIYLTERHSLYNNISKETIEQQTTMILLKFGGEVIKYD